MWYEAATSSPGPVTHPKILGAQKLHHFEVRALLLRVFFFFADGPSCRPTLGPLPTPLNVHVRLDSGVGYPMQGNTVQSKRPCVLAAPHSL
jgi:hypothetical protein